MPKSTPETLKSKRTSKAKKSSNLDTITQKAIKAKKPDVSISAFTGLVNDPTKPLVLAGKLPDLGIQIIRSSAAKTESVIEFTATSLFTTLSIACANIFRIQPYKGNKSYRITPNLSGIIIAEPGSHKSAPVQEVTKPLRILEKAKAKKLAEAAKETEKELTIQKLDNAVHQKKAKETHAALKEQKQGSDKYHELEMELHDALDRIEDSIKPASPTILVLQDPTLKGLIKIAEEQSEPVLIYKDELAPFLEEVYTNKSGSFRRYLIEAMDGKSEYTNVTAHKTTMSVRPPVISLLGTTQPTVINKLISKIISEKVADDGYIDRIQLVSYPCPQYVMEYLGLDTVVDEESLKFYTRIIRILHSTKLKQRIINLDSKATQVFEEFKLKIKEQQKSGMVSTNIKNKLSKYPDMMLSIALVIAILRVYEESQSLSTLKTLKSSDLKMAQKWSVHYYQHMKKLWGATSPAMENAKKILENMEKLTDKNECFTTRDVTQKNWAGINKDSDKARKALNKLVDRKVIEVINTTKTTGRPTEKWRLIANIID
ncbi:DUF3987 domain-containing protein [Pseudomonadota bacterium]